MREVSIERPPNGALIWPSKDDPTPNGMMGMRCFAPMRTASATSSVVWEQHRVGRLVRHLRELVAVLAANRFALGQPFAEARAQLRKRGCKRVRSWSRRASHSAAHLAEKHVRERVGKT